MTETKAQTASRRGFLRLAAASAPAALAAGVLPAAEAEARPAGDDHAPVMADTDHTRAYWASTRF